MDSVDRSQLRCALQDRCEDIVKAWHEAIAQVDSESCDADDVGEVRRWLADLTNRIVSLLLAETFDPALAQEIGTDLARMNCLKPVILGATQDVLARQLTADLSSEQAVAFHPRLVALLSQLAVGFCAHIRQAIRTEYEKTECELREYRQRLEHMVQERTAELVSAVMHLEQEISDRKRVTEALQHRNQELALINRSSQAFVSSLDLDEVLATVLEEVRHWLGAVASSVWLIDPDTGELVCQQATGPQQDVVRGWRLAPGEGIAGWVARHGEGLIVPDIESDERHFKAVDRTTGLPLRSILTVPLRVKERVIGVIQVMDVQKNFFGESELVLLESLAVPAAVAIDNARLVEALRQRTEELQVRNEELDAFSHTVAHDLKNPLTYVVGFAETLEDTYQTMSNDDLDRYLQQIAQNARKVSNIIDELLLLAGVRQMDIEVEPLDMSSIVSEVLERLDYMIESEEAEVVVPDAWPVALGYDPWVEEVWFNYLTNALKYGGETPRVELGAEVEANGMVDFWVRDNGAGLKPEEQACLFTPFTQLKQVRTKGHGLGLSIVRRIVEKLGGRVWVESEVGQGSTFHFALPEG